MREGLRKRSYEQLMAVDYQVSTGDHAKLEKQCEEKTDQTPKKCFSVGGVDLVPDDNQNGIDDDDELIILTPLSLSGEGSNELEPICVDDYEEGSGSSPISGNDHGIKIKIEKGESSNEGSVEVKTVSVDEVERIGAWKQFFCEICADSKLQIDAFAIMGCTHSYCLDCINNFIVTRLDEGFSYLTCPASDCPGFLEPDYCRDIIPTNVFSRWGDALCESVIDPSQKFYCPFKDCSALSILDGNEHITTSECPTCHRLFCVQCKDVWHPEISCSEYQKLGKGESSREDTMLRQPVAEEVPLL